VREETNNNPVPLTEDTIASLLEGCRQGLRSSQKGLYDNLWQYAFTICSRYTSQEAEAMEVMNDGFVKVFMNIHKFNQLESVMLIPAFKSWLKKIMIFTAIDHYRAELKHSHHHDVHELSERLKNNDHGPVDNLSYKELMGLVQCLSPAYRMVFTLFVIEGFSHEEIADRLNISVGTSKSNLAKARDNLRKMLMKMHEEVYTKYER
jgi:RNA polymerase sigma-70 factor, ECF subfamily